MASENKKFKNNGQSVSPKSLNSQNNISVKETDKGNLIEQNFLTRSNPENGREIYNVENDPLGKILASFGLEVTDDDKDKNSTVNLTERSISTDSSIYIKELMNNENSHDIETDTSKTSFSGSTYIQPVKRRSKSKKKSESYILTKDKLPNKCKVSNSQHLPIDNSKINDSSTLFEAPKRKTGRKKAQKESSTSFEEQVIKVIEGTPCQRTRSKKSLVELTL